MSTSEMSANQMSAFEFIDNLDEFDNDSFIKSDKEELDKMDICKHKYNFYKIDYKIGEDIRDKHHDYGDYGLLELKFEELAKKIFKFPKRLRGEGVPYEKYHNNYLKKFQLVNKDILEYIIKKYNINKKYIDDFYKDIHNNFNKDGLNGTKASNEYVYIFIKDYYGDILINKYTMAKFVVFSKIVDHIMRANFRWYNIAMNYPLCYIKTMISFNVDEDGPDELSSIIDFIFIKHFHKHDAFRKLYIPLRIEEMKLYYFVDPTQEKDDFHEYDENGHLKYTFPDFCKEHCLPWMHYIDYLDLDEKETKKRFKKDNYLDYYKTLKHSLFKYVHIICRCNIFDK